MKETLNYLFENNTLSKKEAKSIFLEIGQGKHNNSQIASFMTIFCMRAIHTEEISGFREAMLELSLQVNLKEFLRAVVLLIYWNISESNFLIKKRT